MSKEIVYNQVLHSVRSVSIICQVVDTHLILRRAEQVVPSGMQGQSSDTCLVGTHHLDTVASSDGPHTDGAVRRCREDHRLEG